MFKLKLLAIFKQGYRGKGRGSRLEVPPEVRR